MNRFESFPDRAITLSGSISMEFLRLGINRFHQACRWVQELPYGYNTNRDDIMVLFKERKGSCTTKHAVIATLARELGLSIRKYIGIYPMTDDLVTGSGELLARFELPYLPMVHCFLGDGTHRVDLTEGNRNGKNHSIEEFLYVQRVEPNISAKDEYLLYRQALKAQILTRPEWHGIEMKSILQARQEGLELLRKVLLS